MFGEGRNAESSDIVCGCFAGICDAGSRDDPQKHYAGGGSCESADRSIGSHPAALYRGRVLSGAVGSDDGGGQPVELVEK